MQRLLPAQYPAALALYRAHGAPFPLIGAVLAGDQEGVVYADGTTSPTQVFVEHAFGFAQVFGASLAAFERSLERYLLIDRAFLSPKIRLYTPLLPSFLDDPEHHRLRSWRQHFQLDTTSAPAPSVETMVDATFVDVDMQSVGAVEESFGVVRRFWRTPLDFAGRSNAVLALVNRRPAALCYAAAVADGKAEIDVMTLPEWRNLGLAAVVVGMFNRRCLAQKILPLWDCFTNNAGSMALCRSTGFTPLDSPYPFFTIDRQPPEPR